MDCFPNMSSNDINNFITSNIGAFKAEMYLNSAIPLQHGIGTEPYNIVEFTRGGDAFDYDADGDLLEDRNGNWLIYFTQSLLLYLYHPMLFHQP